MLAASATRYPINFCGLTFGDRGRTHAASFHETGLGTAFFRSSGGGWQVSARLKGAEVVAVSNVEPLFPLRRHHRSSVTVLAGEIEAPMVAMSGEWGRVTGVTGGGEVVAFSEDGSLIWTATIPTTRYVVGATVTCLSPLGLEDAFYCLSMTSNRRCCQGGVAY